MDKDLYEILGVKKESSDGEIRKAFLKLAKKFHPDVNQGNKDAEQKFKEVNLAYEVLKDQKKRKQYDDMKAMGQNPFARAAHAGQYGWSGGNQGFEGFAGGDFGLGDLFEEIFGRGATFDRGGMGGRGTRGRQGPFRAKGSDRESVVHVTLNEAFKGGEKTLEFQDGRRLTVKIPEGVDNGSRIRLAGQGEPGMGGGPSGDLFLVIQVQEHPFFLREGINILLKTPITFSEAVLGAEIEIPTLDGRVHMKIPKGVSSGQRLKLSGRGTLGKDGRRGDQFVELQIKLPKDVSKEEYQKAAELLKEDAFKPRQGLF